MQRRNFLQALALGVGAVALLRPRLPLTLYGDGVRDDTDALQALCNGERVWYRDQLIDHNGWTVAGGTFRLTRPLTLQRRAMV